MMTRRSLVFLLFTIGFLFLAVRVHWSDSELWSIGLARDIFADKNPSVDYKSFFNLILHTVYLPGFGNKGIIDWARVLFALFGLGVLLQMYFAMYNFTGRRLTAAWAAFLLAVSTAFLSQGYKVRSDLLACFVQTAGLFYFSRLYRDKAAGERLSWPEAVGAVALNLLLFLCTPKAIYHFGVNLLFFFGVWRLSRKSWIKKYLLLAFYLPSAAFVTLLVWRHAEFATAIDYFLSSYKASPNHPGFLEAKSFEFIIDVFTKNPGFLLLPLLGVLLRDRQRDSLRNAFAVGAFASFACIFFHNDRLPFFICSLLVFPALYSGLVLENLLHRWNGNSFRRPWMPGLILVSLLILNALLFVHGMLKAAGNETQVMAQKQMQDYLQEHDWPLYYDGTAVLPRNNRIFVFPAPQHPGNRQEVLNTLQRPDLELVFFGNRLFYYLNDAFANLENLYFIRIGPGVFARSYVVRGTHHVSPDEWKKLCTSQGNPTKVHVYLGKNFLSMSESPQTLSCTEDYQPVVTQEPFVAFSKYESLRFPQEMSFARIFDHKAFY